MAASDTRESWVPGWLPPAFLHDPDLFDRLLAASSTPGFFDHVADICSMTESTNRVGDGNLRTTTAGAFEIEMMRPDRREQRREAFHTRGPASVSNRYAGVICPSQSVTVRLLPTSNGGKDWALCLFSVYFQRHKER